MMSSCRWVWWCTVRLPSRHLHQCFQSQVPVGWILVRILSRGPDFGSILLGLDELLPDQCGRLGPGAGKGRVFEGIRSIGHFNSTGDFPFLRMNQQVLDLVSVPQFQIDGLPAQEMSRSRHDVHRGYAAGPGLFHPGFPDIDRIESAHLGLDGYGPVASAHLANVAVGADQTRHDDFARYVAHLGLGRYIDLLGASHREDFVPLDNQDSILEGIAGDGNQLGANQGLDGVLPARGVITHPQDHGPSEEGRFEEIIYSIHAAKKPAGLHSPKQPDFARGWCGRQPGSVVEEQNRSCVDGPRDIPNFAVLKGGRSSGDRAAVF